MPITLSNEQMMMIGGAVLLVLVVMYYSQKRENFSLWGGWNLPQPQPKSESEKSKQLKIELDAFIKSQDDMKKQMFKSPFGGF